MKSIPCTPGLLSLSARRCTASFRSPPWRLLAAAAVAVLAAGCARDDRSAPRAASVPGGGKIAVVGARPALPAGSVPQRAGFFEEVNWDDDELTLRLKGWAPRDVRAEDVRLILRDPFDRLLPAGPSVFSPWPRPDVAAAHPDEPDLLHSGFTASIPVSNIPDDDVWPETLELYCLDGDNRLVRLTPAWAHGRQSWDRAPDRFEAVLTYRTPDLATPEGTQGSLDVCEPGPDAHTVHLTGWAPFDGGRPESTLIVQLAPRLAPASLLSANMLPRPDVRAAVDPNREELDRCGFELLLRIPGDVDDLRRRGAVRLWAIDADNNAVEVGLAALH